MIKRECVDEEGRVGEKGFQRTLAVYQVLAGPEAHELCVYFGRLRGGKLGGFAPRGSAGREGAGEVGEIVHRRRAAGADRDRRFLDALFYGLSTALTLLAEVSFVLVLLGGGIADCRRNRRSKRGRRLYTAALAIGAFLALYRWHGKLTVLYVVLSCGVIGVILQQTVV